MNKKNITIILIISFLILVIPNKINAQGPNSPEAASFEPVDATDMVSLVTGDLSYVLPLLNIPNPEGGYPISLSYHAGIAMGQESSWVGLGWNVNPGAINRTVNGFPDDWKNGKKSNIVFNPGAVDKGFLIGVGVGYGSYANVGLYGSYTSHKSLNGENSNYDRWDAGVQASVGVGGLKISGGLGTDGASLGVAYSGVSIGISQSFIDGSTSINGGFSTGFASVGFNKNLKTNSFSYGASIKMSGVGVNFSSSGNTSITLGSYSGRINTNSGSGTGSVDNTYINFTIPIYGFNITYGYFEQKYWRFNSELTKATGSLYPNNINTELMNELFPNRIVLDSYESIYKANGFEQNAKNNYSFIAYDGYSVSGQGIGGVISPKLYNMGSLKLKSQRSSKGRTSSLIDNNLNNSINSNDIHFYFENFTSSYLRLKSNGISSISNNLNNIFDVDINGVDLVSSVNINGVDYDNYNPSNKRKINGPFIEVFTNNQIINNSSLIYEAENFDRNDYLINQNITEFGDGIGAYKITTLDGKTYHYSLPVYQKELFTRRSQLNHDINNYFVEEQSLTPYATHWLLTAITGPDFIDNGNNVVSNGDLGYWVVFDYGKWSDGFVWKNPPNNYIKTNTSKSYSWGVKEIYYLNKIRTRSHTALFVKEERKDFKSHIITNVGSSRENPKVYEDNSIKTLLTSPVNGNYYIHGVYDKYGPITDLLTSSYVKYKYYYHMNSHKSLRLNKIILLKNTDIPQQLSLTNINEENSIFRGDIYMREDYNIFDTLARLVDSGSSISVDKTWYGEFYENILDTQDIITLTPNIENKALKIIDFVYDYSLAKNTYNSNALTKGKSTLNHLYFRGKSGTNTIPPYSFTYYDVFRPYDIDDFDAWGYRKNNEDVWSLKTIKNPLGSKIKIDYESDDYYKNIVPFKRIFNSGLDFKFNHDVSNNKLIIEIQNDSDENINFLDYFSIGITKVDLFICERYRYWVFLSGWETDTDAININDYINITSVTNNKVIMETNDSVVQEQINRISNYFISLDNYPNDWYMNRTFPIRSCPAEVSNENMIQFQYFIDSNIENPTDLTGGGIRVKSISVKDEQNNSMKKEYSYNLSDFSENPNSSSYRSSGMTSYTPSKFTQEVPYISELPTPNVIYGRVKVKNLDEKNQLINYIIYNYKNLTPLNIDSNEFSISDVFKMKLVNSNVSNNINVGNYYTGTMKNSTITRYKYELTKNLSSIGQIKKYEFFNNNDQLISQKIFNYKNTSDIKQGLSEETFNAYKYIEFSSLYHITTSSKTTYPSILESTTITKGSLSSTTYYDKHDFNTGQLLETRTFGSDGNVFKTKAIPAYTKYSRMGSKVDDINNKNMLSQQTASYSYLWNDTNSEWDILNASINTWNNDWQYKNFMGDLEPQATGNNKIWRKHKSFIWEGDINNDGAYNGFNDTNDDNFDWGVGVTTQPNQKWKNIATTTMYDQYSMPLESKDINDNYTSTKMGDKHSKIFATSNAKYTNMFYSGAEDSIEGSPVWFSGEIRMQTGTSAVSIDNTKAHTGDFSVKAEANIAPFVIEHVENGGKYKLSVWVHKSGNYNNVKVIRPGSPSVNDNVNEMVIAGDWVQLNFTFDLNDGQKVYIKNTSGVTYYDDFRLLPLTSTMTSYVYNEWDELSYIIGANNMAIHYVYNNAGKLKETYVEVADDSENNIIGGFKLSSTNTHKYKRNLN